jgi:hypothetical protein
MLKFKNKLALKEEWVCIDRPYFDAPGGWPAYVPAWEE